MALIPADELSAIMETAPLLRSPKNASRLLRAWRRADTRSGKPESLSKLRREMKLELVHGVSANRVDFLQARYHY